MRIQQTRGDVPPMTWEATAAIAASWLLLALLGLPFARGVSALTVHQIWVWPHGTLVESVLGLIGGDVARGLTRAEAEAVPAAWVVLVFVVVLELLLAVVGVLAVRWSIRTFSPYAIVGLATRSEVSQTLGVRTLHARRRQIRPDLHERHR